LCTPLAVLGLLHFKATQQQQLQAARCLHDVLADFRVAQPQPTELGLVRVSRDVAQQLSKAVEL
jgi:hypothetical protein